MFVNIGGTNNAETYNRYYWTSMWTQRDKRALQQNPTAVSYNFEKMQKERQSEPTVVTIVKRYNDLHSK